MHFANWNLTVQHKQGSITVNRVAQLIGVVPYFKMKYDVNPLTLQLRLGKHV